MWQEGWLGKIYIAIQKLYCESRDSELLDCVVTQGCDTASQATTRRWAQAGAREGRWELGVLALGRKRGVRGAGGRGARGPGGRRQAGACKTREISISEIRAKIVISITTL